ncbi:MAG: MFS transporter [Myxococcota bacterium]|jgi:predicted MFS family arabinose efflux permease
MPSADVNVSSLHARYALGLMSCVTVLNVADRQLLSVLIDPIKTELGVSDAAMGLLTGTSFAVLHVAATIPIAVWADRGVRRSIIALGLAVWSGLTLTTAFARSYAEIFAIRVGVGIGEATGGAPAQSFLSDLFPPQKRASALSILVMGGPIGSMIAFAAGGWLADLYGWRTAFICFGAPGFLLALLIRTTLREPTRGASDAQAPPEEEEEENPAADSVGLCVAADALPVRSSLRFLLRVRSLRYLALASGVNSIGLYAVLIWSMPYMTRVHELGTGQAGTRLAIASGLFTALGTYAGGRLADRLALRDMRWLAWLPSLTSALALPAALGFAFAPNGNWATVLLALASFLVGMHFGPVLSAIQSLAAPSMRALAAALTTTLNNLLGLGLAPPLVGWLNDIGTASFGVDAIRYSLGGIFFVYLIAAVLLLLASTTLVPDLAAKDQMGSVTLN